MIKRSQAQKLHDAAMKAEVAEMSPEDYTRLRDGYYKAAEGLAAVVEILGGQQAGNPLVRELKAANEALAAFEESRLGQVL